MKKYAAYDDQGIWATGDSPEDAIATFYREANADPDDVDTDGTVGMIDTHLEASEVQMITALLAECEKV